MKEPIMHTFDTHKYIKAFQAKGFKEDQAEMFVRLVVESKEFDLSRLATKEQLDKVREEVESIRKELAFTTESIKKELTSTTESLRKEIQITAESLRKDTQLVEERLERKITDSKYDVLKWTIPLLITNTVAVIGIGITIIIKLF